MKKFIPHLTIALSAMTLTFFVIDKFNEYMAFMTSELSKAVFAALAVCSAITSIYLISDNFKEADRLERRRRKKLKQAEKGDRLSEDNES
ncbi:MAG: hypothetical protein II914_00370 [Clostridia bacterium]|nr:hypothetical protein [Clostridia bacterium]MCR5072473.1 hypothetical protein [Clostridiales bacterium]